MNQVRLKAIRAVTVNGASIETGEEFVVSRYQSGALLVRGEAMLAASHPVSASASARPARRRGRPRKVRAEGDPAPRIYRRRDLQAEV